MTDPRDLRQRAQDIREVASSYSESASKTLLEMAEGLEADATRIDEASGSSGEQPEGS